MKSAITEAALYLQKFDGESIVCDRDFLGKLGVARGDCSIALEDCNFACMPLKLGFKRALFYARLSEGEMFFFKTPRQKLARLSLNCAPEGGSRAQFFIRCRLGEPQRAGNWPNTGLFAAEFLAVPNDFIILLGKFFEMKSEAGAERRRASKEERNGDGHGEN